jgi:ABC-2 type transport system ATP-binding protein
VSELALRLRGVEKRYGDTVAVEDLAFDLPVGTICGLLGPNGAGKTTTIRIILDIVGPDAGIVEVLGRPVDPEVRDRVGYLPEERGMYPRMRVVEQLAFFGQLKGMRPPEARREALVWLERLELGHRAGDRVDTLSKGMQQKVQFIATVLHRPDLLILDEPFSGLDPINVDLLRQIVLERKRDGATVLFSTHAIEDAEKICERVCMIAGARKVLDGSLREVKEAAGRRHVILSYEGDPGFLSDPAVESATDHGRWVEIRLAPGGDPQAILRRALETGVRIERFELAEPSLREIFLERAGRRPRAAVGAAPADAARAIPLPRAGGVA